MQWDGDPKGHAMDHRSQGVCNRTRTPRCCVPQHSPPCLPAARCCFAGSRAGWVSNGNRASLNPPCHFPPASTFQGDKKQTLPSEQAGGRDLLAPSRGDAPVGGGVRGMSQGESSPPPHSLGKKIGDSPGRVGPRHPPRCAPPAPGTHPGSLGAAPAAAAPGAAGAARPRPGAERSGAAPRRPPAAARRAAPRTARGRTGRDERGHRGVGVPGSPRWARCPVKILGGERDGQGCPGGGASAAWAAAGLGRTGFIKQAPKSTWRFLWLVVGIGKGWIVTALGSCSRQGGR